MKNTFKSLFSAVASAALVGAANYTQSGNVSVKGTGIVAGIGALVGLTNFFLKSPRTAVPATNAPEAPKVEA